MKTYFLIITTLICLSAGAQQKYDIVTYSLPADWIATQLSPVLTIQKKPDAKKNCRIIIYPSAAGTISNQNEFKAHWEKGAGNMYGKLPDPLNMEIQVAGEWTMYSAGSTLTLNGAQVNRQFTSITNKNVVMNVLIIVSDNACVDDVDAILGSLDFNVSKSNDGINKGKTAVKAKSRPKFRAGKALRDSVN